MAMAWFENIRKQKTEITENTDSVVDYDIEVKAFHQQARENHDRKQERRDKLAVLVQKFGLPSVNLQEKRTILEQLLNENYKKGDVLTSLVFLNAMDNSWEDAHKYAQVFLSMKGRENADRLAVGLFVPQVFHIMGQNDKAKASLQNFFAQTRDEWYKTISKCLLEELPVQTLTMEAAESPEKLLTAHAALAFWAEGSGNSQSAAKHYREALGSYMDDRIEYEFALVRFKRLKES